MPDVFISYSSKDSILANWLHDRLEAIMSRCTLLPYKEVITLSRAGHCRPECPVSPQMVHSARTTSAARRQQRRFRGTQLADRKWRHS